MKILLINIVIIVIINYFKTIHNKNAKFKAINRKLNKKDDVSYNNKLLISNNINQSISNNTHLNINIEKRCENYNYFTNTCTKCYKFYFLYKNNCLDACPNYMISNIITRKCIPLDNNSKYI